MTWGPLEPDALEQIPTLNGAWTWRHRARGLTYRSIYGPAREVEYIFLEMTGLYERSSRWSVLELGFGVATSFLQAARAASARDVALEYTSVEAAPPCPSVIEGDDDAAALAREALDALRGGQAQATLQAPGLRLTLRGAPWLEAPLGPLSVDAVFYDPFGPKEDPGSWCEESFRVAAAAMSPHAILGTWSASRRARRAMQAAGLAVADAPGANGKKSATFAARSAEALALRGLGLWLG